MLDRSFSSKKTSGVRVCIENIGIRLGLGRLIWVRVMVRVTVSVEKM